MKRMLKIALPIAVVIAGFAVASPKEAAANPFTYPGFGLQRPYCAPTPSVYVPRYSFYYATPGLQLGVGYGASYGYFRGPRHICTPQCHHHRHHHGHHHHH